MWFLSLWLTPLTNLLSQTAEKNIPNICLCCVATKFMGQWLLRGSHTLSGQQPSLTKHASLSTCHFKQFPTWYRKLCSPGSSCGTLCLHNHHVCCLLRGAVLRDSWFIRWSPKLWILPCTHLGLLL